MLNQDVNGVDANGDGAIAPIEGEGGLRTAYEHAQYMGALEFFVAQGDELTGLPVAPVPAAQATAAPTSAANEVIIEMVDFEYSQKELTIPVGTTVTWVNNGTKKHSATADDGSFNTGLFDPGQSFSITFDTPGEFQYYCELHGAPGGEGMSAKIIVTAEHGDAGHADATEAAPTQAAPTAPPAGNEIIVEMTDFQFSQPTLTVQVGATVRWVNNGTKKHSATADDGSFNTGLFDPGQSFAITFDTPGEFRYFCELHGGPGGQGMSAVIIVQ
jgi:plastocyanin